MRARGAKKKRAERREGRSDVWDFTVGWLGETAGWACVLGDIKIEGRREGQKKGAKVRHGEKKGEVSETELIRQLWIPIACSTYPANAGLKKKQQNVGPPFARGLVGFLSNVCSSDRLGRLELDGSAFGFPARRRQGCRHWGLRFGQKKKGSIWGSAVC